MSIYRVASERCLWRDGVEPSRENGCDSDRNSVKAKRGLRPRRKPAQCAGDPDPFGSRDSLRALASLACLLRPGSAKARSAPPTSPFGGWAAARESPLSVPPAQTAEPA